MLLTKHPGFITVFSFILLCGNGCTNHDPVTCPSLPAVSVLPPSHIREANVFLDASGSMSGFMKDNSDFQYLVPDLLSRLQRDLPSVHFFALSQTHRPIEPFIVDTARKRIADGRFGFGDASTLPAMFDSAIDHLDTDRISVLITDGIYTPPRVDANMKFQESTDIANVLAKAAKKGRAAACLAFRSAFSNDPKTHITSLYYMFVLGSPSDIAAFKEKVRNSQNAVSSHLANKDVNEQDFGYPVNTVYYTIIPFADKADDGEPANCPEMDNRYLVINNVDKRSTTQFWVGIDLSGLPSYIDQGDYLKDNLNVAGTGLNATKIGDILTADKFASHITDQQTDKPLAAKCTHFVRVQITGLQDKTGTVTISLHKNRPSWVADNSHGDAAHAEQRRDKTYGLDNIFDGLEDVYKEKGPGPFCQDMQIIIIQK